MLYGPVKSIVQHKTSFGVTESVVILSNSTTNETYVLIQKLEDPIDQSALDLELYNNGYNKMVLTFLTNVTLTVAKGDEIKTLTQIEEATGKKAVYLYWQAPLV